MALASVVPAGARIPRAVLGLGALLLAACSPAAAPAGSSALGVGMTVFSPASAPQVPPVAGDLVGGGKLSLEAYRGHVVVVNFWGSWCTVCRQEALPGGSSAGCQRGAWRSWWR